MSSSPHYKEAKFCFDDAKELRRIAREAWDPTRF